MTVAVHTLTISASPFFVANALAIDIVAMVGACKLLTSLALVSRVAVADAVHALPTHAALKNTLGLLTISTLIRLITCTFAAHIAAVI